MRDNLLFVRMIKDGIFAVGIDDAPHDRENLTTELFFVFCRGTLLERINHASIDVDGLNSTDIIIKNLKTIKEQFQIILTHGITTGGFNVLDIEMISNLLEIPVIAITENSPRGKFLEAIKNLPNYEERKAIIDRAGTLNSYITPIGKKPVYFYTKGIEKKTAIQFLKKFAIRSRLPEQLLLAHKIASGWTLK